VRIVVTGALGHIGSALVRSLPRAFPNAEILMVDDLSTQRYCSLFDLPQEGRYRFVEADILRADLRELFEGADAVVHLAAVTNAEQSFDAAELVERVNLQGTERVATECARGGATLLFLSTTSVYGVQSGVVDEDCPREQLVPQSPYAASKLRAEELLAALARDGLRAIVLRFGTIVGRSPGMRFHTAVNKFCWQAAMGTPLTVWRTALDQRRPYLELGDGVRAIEFALERRPHGRLFNVVTANATVGEIVDHVRAFVPDVSIELVESRVMNQLSYEVDGLRIRAAGLELRGDLRAAIGATVDALRGVRRWTPQGLVSSRA
jgi:nucleoside-diphosphate-sugar epimerase